MQGATGVSPGLGRRSRPLSSRVLEWSIERTLFLCALVSIGTTAGIIAVLAFETVEFFRAVQLWEFLTDTQWTPLFTDKHFGILPLVSGTVLVAGGAMVVSLPLGLMAAIFLSEYASDRARRVLKPLLELLAGIPTVVYGYFALLFVTPILRELIPQTEIFNALSASLVIGIMIIPLVSSLSEDAMTAVPHSLREAAYALGATPAEGVLKVVVPAASSGIAASFILAVSRAIGETMIVTIAAGQQPRLTLNPLESIETMTAYIVQVSLGDTPHGSLEFKTLFAVGMGLFLMTLALNVLSQWILHRFREQYQ